MAVPDGDLHRGILGSVGRAAGARCTGAPLLNFYDFSAEHWHHIRTSDPIESTFASVRLRTAKTRDCGSRASILSMVFNLSKSAEKRRLKLRGTEMIAKVITGTQFKNLDLQEVVWVILGGKHGWKPHGYWLSDNSQGA